MHSLEYKFVFQKLTEQQKQQIINMWTSERILNKEDAIARVNQVATIAVHKSEIVGVSTIYLNDFTTVNNPYFFLRMFMTKEFRSNRDFRTVSLKLLFKNLKQQYSNHAHGLVIELENQQLARLAAETPYMRRRGFSYFGKSPRGLQLWYVRFDEPRGIFAKSLQE